MDPDFRQDDGDGKRAKPSALTRPVIGMPRQNRGGAPQLLGQHGPRQHVRPGHVAEGDQQIGLGAHGIAVAIGGADQEARLAHALVAPVPEQRGEFFRRELAPALVEQDLAEGRGRGRRQGAARIGQLADPERPGDPPGIAIDEIGLRRTADLAPGNDVQFQITRPRPLRRRRSPTSARGCRSCALRGGTGGRRRRRHRPGPSRPRAGPRCGHGRSRPA